MPQSDVIEALANAFHQAAFEPELWPAALQGLGDALGESSIVANTYTPHGTQLINAIRSSAASYWAQVQRESSLEAIQPGVILTDANSRVFVMNAAARSIVDRADGLRLGSGKLLTAAAREDSARLYRLIATAAALATSGEREPRVEADLAASGCNVTRPSGSRPLALLVAPLRTASFMGLPITPEMVSVIIFVSDPDQEFAIPGRLIAEVHGLTPSEAELVSLLLAAHDLRSAASVLGISMNTAKTLLQRCFERTGTHRQTELLMQVLRGPLGQARAGSAALRAR